MKTIINLGIFCTLFLIACTQPIENKNLSLKDVIQVCENHAASKHVKNLQKKAQEHFIIWAGYDYFIDKASLSDTLHFKSTKEIIDKGWVNTLMLAKYIANDTSAYVLLFQLKTKVELQFWITKRAGVAHVDSFESSYKEDVHTPYDALITVAVQKIPNIKKNSAEDYFKHSYISPKDSLWLYKGQKPKYLF